MSKEANFAFSGDFDDGEDIGDWLIQRGADTFEAHQHMTNAMWEIDWLFERNNLANINKIIDHIKEKLPGKDAA